MWSIVIGIVVFVVTIVILRLIGRLLCRFIMEPLANFCEDKDYSISPFPLGIWTAILVAEHVSHIVYNRLFESWLSPAIYSYLIIGLMAIPYIVLLVKTKVIYFIPVMLAKILVLPLGLIGILCGYEAPPNLLDNLTPTAIKAITNYRKMK